MLDDDELCSLSRFEPLDDEWVPKLPLKLPKIITSEFEELDDVGDDELLDLFGEPVECDDLNLFTLQLLQHHDSSWPLIKSESFICGL